VRAAIVAHARRDAPAECCGLLVGQGDVVDECVPCRNVHPTPRTRYLLDPADHIATRRRLRGTDRAVLGCYHSHPRSSPHPSATDLAEALYPDFIWVIVSLAAADSEEVAAYRIDAGACVPVPVHVVSAALPSVAAPLSCGLVEDDRCGDADVQRRR
jgi:desampylase